MSTTAYNNYHASNLKNICREKSIPTTESAAAATTAVTSTEYCTPLKGNTTVLAEDSNLKLLNENYSSTAGSSNYDLSYYFDQSISTSTTTTFTNETPNVIYKRGRSLSIGSTISVSHQQPIQPQPFVILSDENKTQIYKKKNDRSNKKAFQFFGEQVKLEISAKEIKREGLRALLHSTVPLGYFLYHLLNEYSSENLVIYIYNSYFCLFNLIILVLLFGC